MRRDIAVAVIGLLAGLYVWRTEYRLATQQREIASLEERTKAAVSLVIQATANVHQRVRMLEARRNPGGEF